MNFQKWQLFLWLTRGLTKLMFCDVPNRVQNLNIHRIVFFLEKRQNVFGRSASISDATIPQSFENFVLRTFREDDQQNLGKLTSNSLSESIQLSL